MAERIHDFLGAPHALRTIPGFYAPRPGIQIGCSIAHDATVNRWLQGLLTRCQLTRRSRRPGRRCTLV